jgi:hypothetical protein
MPLFCIALLALLLTAILLILSGKRRFRQLGGPFLDDIIPELDRFLSDFPSLFPAGRYSTARSHPMEQSFSDRSGCIVLSREEGDLWIGITGSTERRLYAFSDAEAFSTMAGFTLGIIMEMDALNCGVSVIETDGIKSHPLSKGDLNRIAQTFKKEYGIC